MADRDFGAPLEAALSAELVELAFLVYLNWSFRVEAAYDDQAYDPTSYGADAYSFVDSAPGVFLWSGVGEIEYGGQTWLGLGHIGNIDKVADSVEKADIGVELTLNYLDDDLRNNVTGVSPVGSDAGIYLALVDTATRTITDAYQIFTGFIDRCEILDSGETGQIVVRLASELARLNRPRYFLLNHAHQQYLFPGDLGCEFASRMQEAIQWGRKPTALAPSVPYPTLSTGYDHGNWQVPGG